MEVRKRAQPVIEFVIGSKMKPPIISIITLIKVNNKSYKAVDDETNKTSLIIATQGHLIKDNTFSGYNSDDEQDLPAERHETRSTSTHTY